jgi:hypothetical protein
LRRCPDATRSGMAIETGEPIPTSSPPHSCECAVKPVGVRAIPADHDVYPRGDEPQGATIQTEPLTRTPCGEQTKSPSGPVFSSQCQQNRQTLADRSPTRLQTFSSSLDDCVSVRSTVRSATAAEPSGSSARRNNCFCGGGACRDRTDDPLLAKQVLSQLS